ncbi:hypothetical protein BDF19DRAFT_451807 [Syncephalis fuscata]|nr:hypothetical protein BDF19DRAFT_451807 [Syncephalis fuscata]
MLLEENTEHKSPFLCVENKLGIPVQQIPSLYGYARQLLWYCEKRPEPTATWECTSQFNDTLLVNNLSTTTTPPSIALSNQMRDVNSQKLLTIREQASRCLMLLQPENYTAINIRRSLLFNEKQLSLADELHWTSIALTAPNGRKSGVGWQYRRDLILYSSNSWSWPDIAIEKQLIDAEEKFTEHWTATHLSDSAAWHYRRRILSIKSSIDCWQKEAVRVCDLIDRYLGHEAVWCHLRLIYTSLNEASLAEDRNELLNRQLDWVNWLKDNLHTNYREPLDSLHRQLRNAEAYIMWIEYTNTILTNKITKASTFVKLKQPPPKHPI